MELYKIYFFVLVPVPRGFWAGGWIHKIEGNHKVNVAIQLTLFPWL